jgi:hypothetical protein
MTVNNAGAEKGSIANWEHWASICSIAGVLLLFLATRSLVEGRALAPNIRTTISLIIILAFFGTRFLDPRRRLFRAVEIGMICLLAAWAGEHGFFDNIRSMLLFPMIAVYAALAVAAQRYLRDLDVTRFYFLALALVCMYAWLEHRTDFLANQWGQSLIYCAFTMLIMRLTSVLTRKYWNGEYK